MRPKFSMKAHAEETQQWRTAHTHPRHSKPEKRTWLHMDVHGISQDLEVGKHVIMRRAHLPARDLRLLDPLLSYPSVILGREHAIVVNLEHIKTIITAQEVFLLDAYNPIVAPFVKDLRCRLPSNHSNQTSSLDGCDHTGPEYEHHPEDREGGDNTPINSPVDPSINDSQTREKSDGVDLNVTGTKVEILAREPSVFILHPNPSNRSCSLSSEPSLLPFEFRALEICLEAACHRLDLQASVLAKDAQSALDALTSQVSTRNLEIVRQIKNQLVLISARAQRVRDEIENLLDDDGDMAEMYLTDKLIRQQLEKSLSPKNSETRSQNSHNGDGTENTACSSHAEFSPEDTLKHCQDTNSKDQLPPAVNTRQKKHSPTHDRLSPPRNEEHLKQKDHGIQLHQSKSPPAKQSRLPVKSIIFMENHHSHQRKNISPVTAVNGKRNGVEELEMLLEAYFVHVDGILQHVASVKESVDDTEDYVKIMLDDHQNTMLTVNIVLTISCLVISIFIVITGIFGMNIEIPLFTQGGPHDFWTIVGVSSAGTIVLLALIIGWCKYTYLI